jgi:serine/threonine-protein kinase
VTTQSDPSIPAGQVISSKPAAGAEVDPGNAVALVVSSGPGKVAVPAVVGLSESVASGRVQDAGLVPSVTTQSDPSIPAGQVISSKPAAGTEVDPGSTVTLVVSSGPGLN